VSSAAEGGRLHLPPDQRYRLYVDESGDHVYEHLADERHRYLCLLGCWFRGDSYERFHADLEAFEKQHVPRSPDEPVILHREDIVNHRGPFWRLRDQTARAAFDDGLVKLVADASFTLVAVVIDKAGLRAKYPTPSHPYHLALGFMLQRYCGYLNHVSRRGDVMAESRGGREDRLLMDSHERVYGQGVWMTHAADFQRALTSRQLKVKPKTSNIAGLQLADILAHPVRDMVLAYYGRRGEEFAPFSSRILVAVKNKYNRQLYSGNAEGYGFVLFPK